MADEAATELILIRHAPALTEGRLCGRTDVAADCSDLAALAALRLGVGDPGRIVVSPALRCRQTAAALWPVAGVEENPALWEQDFGAWEGRPTGEIPDLGPMTNGALAEHRPPGGESFADLCARVGPALTGLATGGRVTIVAHAGTVRAALALALGSVAPALGFTVAPLSMTRITALPRGAWSIGTVNWGPA
ncbi:MAG: histidine phosphatase family protein [Rhodobacteraceae bacterium]|uniref:histidine phosphatase family protein n=1 Tax=Albidovulum sp. TaxID=1872424 RepID=UPI001DDB6653|nr:histidine phosphatase family protein [uncultured Defluviimonas sp.]MCB2126140.1 histidine phosphatase family protein [Paracoccaceae bacterium]MCC0071018.1 histidine phosphatase family protein [Paracoccaceae bacterium]